MKYTDPDGKSSISGVMRGAVDAGPFIVAALIMDPDFRQDVADAAAAGWEALGKAGEKTMAASDALKQGISEAVKGKDDAGDKQEGYKPAPKELPGIPDAKPTKRKTPVQGGGSLRKRWKDGAGNIYEWDSRHGELEKYNKRGKHQGAVDPDTGKVTKGPENRKVDP